MCGIAGIFGEDETRIRRMTEALVHRGPDGNAFVVSNGVSLGHARLAILDPRPIGDQPMWNDDHSIVIVFNGEIYNYRRLKEKYGLQCKTGTDTEVILKLYEKTGMDFVEELLGMFAFGIFDTRTHTWHIARDPEGIKPLFMIANQKEFSFASEMRSLIAGQSVKPSLNFTSLSLFLRLQYVPGPETMCEGIESVPPGMVLSWINGSIERKIVHPKITPAPRKSISEYKRDIPALMSDIVKDHLISDKPIGIFLSGGMDSSIALHHMREHTPGTLKTFTVRFDATKEEGADRFNADAELAKKTAEFYGTEHHEVFLSAELCRNVYRDAARALDQPNADAVSPAMYILSREAKKHVDVVLTGAGGDEIFGGYPRYRVVHILHSLRMIPGPLRGLLGSLLGHPRDVLQMSPGARLAARLLSRRDSEWEQVMQGSWYEKGSVEQLFMDRYPKNIGDPVHAFMEFDKNLWLVDESLKLSDGLTMAHGLEARVPFLDPRLDALLKNSDGSMHITWKRTKALLKDAYRGILPDHLYTLPKASFYPPLAKWIRRECAPLVEEALANPFIAELFDVQALHKLFDEHKNGGYHLHVLSAIMQLHCWHAEVYDVQY